MYIHNIVLPFGQHHYHLGLTSLKFGNDTCSAPWKKDGVITARKQLNLSSLKFQNDTSPSRVSSLLVKKQVEFKLY